MNVWLGGLFTAEAYITATRQLVAQANAWSLEELMLQVTVTDGKTPLDDCSFAISGKCSNLTVAYFELHNM
jgi:dynein heavy chain 1